jgi:hypothetical protein
MIEQAWTEAFQEAASLTKSSADAARLVSLSVVAVAANKRGLLAPLVEDLTDYNSLRKAIEQFALFPLPPISRDIGVWKRLAVRATSIGERLDEPRVLDDWVEAWQASSHERKVRGAYATPAVFASALAAATLRPFSDCRQTPRVIDPAAGAGALLIAAYRVLIKGRPIVDQKKILRGLYGLEADPVARELCCLTLWLIAGSDTADLNEIAKNIVVGDAITLNWWKQPRAFDALLMNPPWESLRHSLGPTDPHYVARCAMISRLSREEPGTTGLPSLYTAQGRGDRNLFKAFIELAPHLIREGGRLGALVPGAFASDLGMAPLRRRYFEQLEVESWTGFENLRRHFPIDSRYKFGILVGTRSHMGTTELRMRSFAADPHEITEEHALVTISELPRLGGPSLMLPELRDQGEKEIVTQALSEGVGFFETGPLGTVKYKREVDMTNGLRDKTFARFETHKLLLAGADGLFKTVDGQTLVPIVEGRMVGQYDVFQKSWLEGQGRTAKWESSNDRPLQKCRPQFVTAPRDIGKTSVTRIAICDVTSATNGRTVHATWIPDGWRCGNTAPVLMFDNPVKALAGLGVLNSMVFDWIARRIVSGLHLNKFYLAALAWPKLSSSDITDIAEAAATLSVRNSRFMAAGGDKLLVRADLAKLDRIAAVDAHVRIETIVARRFGLDSKMASRVFSPTKEDRRGFWRYFASEPTAKTIGGLVGKQLQTTVRKNSTKRPSSRARPLVTAELQA